MNYNRKTLEDLYSQVAGKPVAQRKHLDIWTEQDEKENTPQEEKQVEITIDKIHEALDNLSTSLEDPDELKKLYNRILNFKSYKHIKHSLTDKGYSDLIYKKFSNDVQRLIEDIPEKDRDAFLEYIQRPTEEQATLSDLNHTGNIFNSLAETGISKDTIMRIFQHTGQDEGGRGVGMGELALALLFGNLGAGGQKKRTSVASATSAFNAAKDAAKEQGVAYGEDKIKQRLKNYKEGDVMVPLDKAYVALQEVKKESVKGDLELNGEEFEIKGESASLGARADAIHKRRAKNTDAYLNSIGAKRKGKQYTLNGQVIGSNLGDFPTVIATAYKQLDNQSDRNSFIENFKQFISVSGEMGDAVEQGWDKVNIDMSDPYRIQRGISFLGFLQYALDEQFKYFMAHDVGRGGKDTGHYVLVGGTPLDMMIALSNTSVGFEAIAHSNLRPRIGFANNKMRRAAPVSSTNIEDNGTEEEEIEYI